MRRVIEWHDVKRARLRISGMPRAREAIRAAAGLLLRRRRLVVPPRRDRAPCAGRPCRRSCARFEESVRELTPIQAISEDSRPYSIFGQRFITTFSPLSSASAAASSLRT